jgi:DNA-binding NtrC family response regulator
MDVKSEHGNKNILVVDDDPHIVELNYDILVSEGYQITKALSGEGALKELEGKKFDLVVTDLNMGKVGGISVLKRAKELHPETKVIITTGNMDIHYAIEALRLHADDYLLKPFDISELLDRVSQCLN